MSTATASKVTHPIALGDGSVYLTVEQGCAFVRELGKDPDAPLATSALREMALSRAMTTHEPNPPTEGKSVAVEVPEVEPESPGGDSTFEDL